MRDDMDELRRQAAAWRDHVDEAEFWRRPSHGPGGSDSSAVEAPEHVNLRKKCLETALKYTTADRNAAHGDPESNFSNIAAYWNAHLHARYGDVLPQNVNGADFALDAVDVALMMAGMKAARLSYNPSHEDSWIDLAGYAACGMDIALRHRDDPDA